MTVAAAGAITAADSYGYYDFYISMESSVLFRHSRSLTHTHAFGMCIHSSSVTTAQQHKTNETTRRNEKFRIITITIRK